MSLLVHTPEYKTLPQAQKILTLVFCCVAAGCWQPTHQPQGDPLARFRWGSL